MWCVPRSPSASSDPALDEDDETLAIKLIQRLDQIDAERAARDGLPARTPSPIDEARALGCLNALLLKRLDLKNAPNRSPANVPSLQDSQKTNPRPSTEVLG